MVSRIAIFKYKDLDGYSMTVQRITVSPILPYLLSRHTFCPVYGFARKVLPLFCAQGSIYIYRAWRNMTKAHCSALAENAKAM